MKCCIFAPEPSLCPGLRLIRNSIIAGCMWLRDFSWRDAATDVMTAFCRSSFFFPFPLSVSGELYALEIRIIYLIRERISHQETAGGPLSTVVKDSCSSIKQRMKSTDALIARTWNFTSPSLVSSASHKLYLTHAVEAD